QVLIESGVSLREDVVDESLVLEHLLLHELRHGVERKLARVCDQLGKLRGEAVDEPGHRAVCFGVVMCNVADRLVDPVTFTDAPRLGKLSRRSVAESAAQ